MHQDVVTRPLRVCFFGTYDIDQPRTRVMMEGLRQVGIEVTECRVQLWSGTAQKVALAQQPWTLFRKLRQIGRAYYSLLTKSRQIGRCDAVVYAHLGQVDLVLTAWWFRLRSIPIIWDALVSLYDTVVDDRGLLTGQSIWGRWLRRVDQLAGRLADVVLVDTLQNRTFWHTRFSIPLPKLHLVYVGAEDLFARIHPKTKTNSHFNVLFYGKYIPLHGIGTILRAAKDLAEIDHINWTIIGTGQQRPYIDDLAKTLKVRNVRFVDWVPYSELPVYIAQADLCLGIFGKSDKAMRVVPNKAYQALASQRPLITADTPAARSILFRDGLEGALLVPPENATALADAVLELSRSPQRCMELAQDGFKLYRRYYSSRAIGQQVVDILTASVQF